MTFGQVAFCRILLCVTMGVVLVNLEVSLLAYVIVIALFIGYGMLCQQSGVLLDEEKKRRESSNV